VIDAFVATFDPTRFNFIIVSNDVSGSPGLPPVDPYSATGEMDTPDDGLDQPPADSTPGASRWRIPPGRSA
jgi:hypothetical protein